MGSAMKSNQSTFAGGGTGSSGGGAAAPSGGTAGLGRSGLGTSGGQRLPASQRERKPALAALAVLLILGGALASAYLVMASGERVSAVRIAQPVAAGQKIPASALEEVQVGDTGIQFISWSERANVTRYYAAVPLVKGALLTNSMISPSDGPAKGRLVVGLALKPGQFPAGGVDIGKHVSLYAVGGAQDGGPRPGTVLAQDAIVIGVSGGGSGGGGDLGGTRLQSDQTSVDVAVLPADAPQVTQAASAGTIALALIPEGTKVAATPGGRPPAGGGQDPEGTETPDGTVPVPGGGGAPGQSGTPAPGSGGN
ncbi:hypothetical protein E1281_34050 [Actinomadura sp. KC345]|uniref:hypothetical protein n=1 Tax=Actinomadura sp. KC345 TaxID=2530371 RepID=UPI0010435AB9|nr:hypothetical protein [Actinomadura sp. KC345]TDC44422.1 hypothetical protein E1281_34050 [Actinomadura sp. KC345]